MAFKTLQKLLSRPSFLYYFDDTADLYIDLDASKVYGFGAIVYHLKGELKTVYPTISQIKPVLFLSRLLKDTETRY